MVQPKPHSEKTSEEVANSMEANCTSTKVEGLKNFFPPHQITARAESDQAGGQQWAGKPTQTACSAECG
jgi:hypothetical protein